MRGGAGWGREHIPSPHHPIGDPHSEERAVTGDDGDMTFPDYDDDLPGHVERALADFLVAAAAPIREREPTFGPCLDALRTFVLGGGKRLRPTFAWWAWRGAGGDPAGPHAEGVLRAIASLELVQACALIHDDLIDSSDSRRGAATVHVAFAKRHADAGLLGESSQYGLAAAVLIGDLAQAWADDMYNTAPLPADTLAAGHQAWRAMRTEVLAGQQLDIHTQASGDASIDAALRVARLKTASYTVQRPMHLGAALAGADTEMIDTLLRFGRDLGVAFQLRDDLLGVFGDPTVTGKPAGDDLREGKRTLLVALGAQFTAEGGDNAAHDVITGAVGDAQLTQPRLEAVRTALRGSGAVDAVERRIRTLHDTSVATLHEAGLTEPARGKLTELAANATERTV